MPISLAIVTTIVMLVVTLLGLVLAISYFASLKNTQRLLGELSAQTSSFVGDELRDYLDPVTELAEWSANLIATGPFDLTDDQHLGSFLLGTLAATPHVNAIAYITPERQIIQASRGDLGKIWSLETNPPKDTGFIERTLQSGREKDDGFWNEVLFRERTQRSYINYVQPIRREGEFHGVVLAAVSLNELSGITNRISNRRRGTVFILAGKGQVIAHPNLTSGHPELSRENPTVGIRHVGDLILGQFWSAESHPVATYAKPKGLVLRQAEVFGRMYIFAHAEVAGYSEDTWIVGHHLNAELAEVALRSLRESAIGGVVILVLGIALAIFLGRKIALPIRVASAGVARVAELEISKVEELPRSVFVELDAQARSFNAMLGALRKFETYVPRSLVRRLIARGETAIASEERDLTVLFTDMVGFTSTTESMTAGETALLLNHHFALLGSCIEAEEGTIDKFIGDALMAFWGAPDLQPDQSDRAVRAVCEIARLVQEDNISRRAQGLPPVRMRLGLHRGPAVVGNIGAPARMNYTVVGDTVNTASRIEGLGKEIDPNADIIILASETVIGACTLRMSPKLVGTYTIKGKVEPVEVYRIFA